MGSYAAFTSAYGDCWKTVVTARALTYRYLSVPPGESGVTLLFLHGFVSTVYDWHHQLDFFRAKGYGLLAPDMLGYGGTDKPRDTRLYRHTPMAQDVMDIIAAELPADMPLVAIGHDWGVAVLNRLVCYHGKRFAGFVFLNVAYMGPNPNPPHKLDELIPFSKSINGKELYAYWELLTRPGADAICEENFDSFIDLWYAEDALPVWNSFMLRRHKAEEFVESGKRLPRTKFVDAEHYEILREQLLGPARGLWGALAWYKMWTDGHHAAEDRKLVQDGFFTIRISQPVMFVEAARDAVCLTAWMRPLMEKVAKHLTVIELDTSHWIYLEQPVRLNAELDKWLEGKVLRV